MFSADREPDSELGPWQQNASTAVEAPKRLNKECLWCLKQGQQGGCGGLLTGLNLLWDWPSCWMWFLNQPSLVDYTRRANSQNSNGKLFPLGWWGTKSKSSVNLDFHMWCSDGVGPWMNYMQPKKLMLHTWRPHLKGRTASEKTLPGIKELWRAESALIWYASKGRSPVTLWSSTGIMYNKWARTQIERRAKKQ